LVPVGGRLFTWNRLAKSPRGYNGSGVIEDSETVATQTSVKPRVMVLVVPPSGEPVCNGFFRMGNKLSVPSRFKKLLASVEDREFRTRPVQLRADSTPGVFDLFGSLLDLLSISVQQTKIRKQILDFWYLSQLNPF